MTERSKKLEDEEMGLPADEFDRMMRQALQVPQAPPEPKKPVGRPKTKANRSRRRAGK